MHVYVCIGAYLSIAFISLLLIFANASLFFLRLAVYLSIPLWVGSFIRETCTCSLSDY